MICVSVYDRLKMFKFHVVKCRKSNSTKVIEMNELDIKSEIFYHFRFMGFQKSGRILHTNTWRNIDQLIENYEYIGPLTDY